jgi:hypothetical protein
MRQRDSKRKPPDHDQESEQENAGPLELAIVGDLTDNEADLTDRLLGVEPGGACTIYFWSRSYGSVEFKPRPW